MDTDAEKPVTYRDVLKEDSADSVYIFAPAGIGLLIGTLFAPRLIRRYGERRLSIVSLVFMCVSTVPVVRQGATFGIQKVQENAVILIAVLGLGAIATAVGPALVMVVAPILVVSVVLILIRYSYRHVAQESIYNVEALKLLATDEDQEAS
jgi:MFS family permease